ncbi:WD40 repeat-like protein, partial [Delitschia confertaspora ATCC 74209]
MATSRTLPIPHNLLITTPSTIYLYSHSTTKTLFECSETSGILTVKAARDNSGLLAIADSQLVILHDITQGTDRKHTLKRGDGSPRILLFTPDSKTLIFTTTLSNTIQTYSISTGELLPPLQSHPSPPTAVTISPNGTILLTASSKPPTVLLQDMRTIGAAALTFRPTISEAAVSCASFQCKHSRGQENYTTFILGFRDGTLALYRLYIPNLPRNPQAWRLYPQRVLLHKPNELGVYRRLHKPAMGGITAAEFLPGYKARVISVGYDGLCLSVNLGKPNKSVGRTQKAVNFSDSTIEVEELPYQGIETLIAIGIQTGKVLIFNILGLLVHEVVLDFPVIGVEWVGDMSAPCPLPRRASMSP